MFKPSIVKSDERELSGFKGYIPAFSNPDLMFFELHALVAEDKKNL